jgi:hypothetical protein
MIINGIEISGGGGSAGTSGSSGSSGSAGTSGISQINVDGGSPSSTYGGTITLDGGGV